MTTIGVQMMMLKDEVSKQGPREVLRRLAEIGFPSVEVSQIPMTTENVAELRQGCDEFGVQIAALSAGLGPGTNDSLLTDYDKIVADARALAATRVRIGMLPIAALASAETLLEFCRSADEFARRLADDGITLYYHNHHLEFAKRNGTTLLDTIRNEAPAMRFEIDVHWVQRGGKDPVRTLEQYRGVVDLVHLKDYRISHLPDTFFAALAAGDNPPVGPEFSRVVQFAEVGEGNLEWQEIIDQSLASGAEHLLIEQDDQYGRDVYDSLQISRDNLVALGYEKLLAMP